MTLDFDYIASIKRNIVNIPKVLDGLVELIDACHNRMNTLSKEKVVLRENMATYEERAEVNDEIEENSQTCGKLNYLFDILASPEKKEENEDEEGRQDSNLEG